MSKIIYLKNIETGVVSRFSEGTIKALRGIPAGWIEVDKPEPTIRPIKLGSTPPAEPEATPEEMANFLREKGETVRWNLSETKLRERYENLRKKDRENTGSDQGPVEEDA